MECHQSTKVGLEVNGIQRLKMEILFRIHSFWKSNSIFAFSKNVCPLTSVHGLMCNFVKAQHVKQLSMLMQVCDTDNVCSWDHEFKSCQYSIFASSRNVYLPTSVHSPMRKRCWPNLYSEGTWNFGKAQHVTQVMCMHV